MKKKKCPEFENHERWLVSYADMMTLLFALFVVLYALKDIDVSDTSVGQVAAASSEVFSGGLEEIPPEKDKALDAAGFGVFDQFESLGQKVDLIRTAPNSKERTMMINNEIEKLKLKLEAPKAGVTKSNKTATKGSSRIISVEKAQEGITIKLLASNFYQGGQYKLNEKVKKYLDKIASEIKEIGRPVTVEGHTDNIPPAGSFGNWEISSLRASYVVRYLINKHKFPMSQISAAGWADSKPVAHNGTSFGRKLNRRIEIKIKYD